jgi:hypothetical protein
VESLLAEGVEVPYGSAELDVGPFIVLWLGYEAEAQLVQVWVKPQLPDLTACSEPVTFPFGI